MADRDAAGVRAAINGIARAQTSLRETQVDHGGTLRGIAEAVAVLVTGQAALTDGQAALTETVGRHEGILARLVEGQEALRAGQAEVLRRLSSEG